MCGSLQRSSANRAALDIARATLSASGVEVSALEGLGSIPPMNPDRRDDPGEAVLAFRAELAAADAVLIASRTSNKGGTGKSRLPAERLLGGEAAGLDVHPS